MGIVNELSARHIEEGISGRVLSIGGMWPRHSPQAISELGLVVADVSEEMLRPHKEAGISTVRDDARALPFPDRGFDHVVLPLVLHHITERSWRAARREVKKVLGEVGRVLTRGGRVWISEFSVGRPVYWAEAVGAPVTRFVLGFADIPLVVMHTRRTSIAAPWLKRASVKRPRTIRTRPVRAGAIRFLPSLVFPGSGCLEGSIRYGRWSCRRGPRGSQA